MGLLTVRTRFNNGLAAKMSLLAQVLSFYRLLWQTFALYLHRIHMLLWPIGQRRHKDNELGLHSIMFVPSFVYISQCFNKTVCILYSRCSYVTISDDSNNNKTSRLAEPQSIDHFESTAWALQMSRTCRFMKLWALGPAWTVRASETARVEKHNCSRFSNGGTFRWLVCQLGCDCLMHNIELRFSRPWWVIDFLICQ